MDLLPDSRAKRAKGAKLFHGAYWVPVYCANCGIPYGFVPEENCTFACWLCNQCSDKYGAIADTYFMPDEVFWERVKNEQLDKHGRLLTEQELKVVQDDNNSSLGKLLNEGK